MLYFQRSNRNVESVNSKTTEENLDSLDDYYDGFLEYDLKLNKESTAYSHKDRLFLKFHIVLLLIIVFLLTLLCVHFL